MWPFTVGQDFMLGNSLFGAGKLTKNADSDKYKYSGIRFDESGSLLLSDGSGFGKNVIILGADMSSNVHIHYKKKNVLILGKVQYKD